MRRFNLAAALFAAVLTASGAWANIPDLDLCTVEAGIINADPYDHPYGTTAAERYQDLVITLYNESLGPVAGVPAADFSFSVYPHSGYPNLGGGAGGTCPDCHLQYTVTCQYAASNALGEMLVRVEVGPPCAPSFTCPVEIDVTIADVGTLTSKMEVLMNSFDMVPNGDVRGPDFARFSTAYNNWTGSGTLDPEADFVWVLTPVPQGDWGEVTGPDFAAFSTAYKDCCGHPKEDNPANCDPFTNVCP